MRSKTRRGCSNQVFNLMIQQNERATIPHPLTRELPLHKGAFFMFGITRELPLHKGAFFIFGITQEFPLLGGFLYLLPLLEGGFFVYLLTDHFQKILMHSCVFA